MPDQLANWLAKAVSQRQAVIDMLASAAAAVAGHAARRGAEAERLQLNLRRFLETPAGQNQKARVNESLARSLRAAGLEVRGLE
jgi:conjugal transfer/entry exclusion protein